MPNELTAPLDDFTPREIEILNYMAAGLTNQEIADQLFITRETVRWYNKQIYSKLGTSRRTEAVLLAQQFGLLEDNRTDEESQLSITQPELPTPNGPFIGRDTEIAELSDLLKSTENRLISIIAAGGMGKSRLSLELAHAVRANFVDGAAFVDLTAIRSPEAIVDAALDALRLQCSDKQLPQQILLNYCREKNLLLVFDNCEHVMAGVGGFADILDMAPDVRIIATSREKLNLRLETTYYLQPIINEASRLFIETASQMYPTIHIEDDNLPQVERIVQLVGGMPLGMVLAATWLDALSVEEIADEIEQSLEFLSADLSDMPDRQRSIHAVIEPTWERLQEAERNAFLWASVFRNGFTRQTFQQLTGASVRVLKQILARSLITANPNRRYDMHPLLRQYAREKLEASDSVSTAKEQHAQVFLKLIQQQNAELYNGHFLDGLAAIEVERDNYKAAMEWALSGNAVALGTQIAVALSNFWDIRAQATEALKYLTLALSQIEDDSLRGWALCWRSRFNYRLGDKATARIDVVEALTLAEKLHDQELLVRSLNYLAHLQKRDEALVLVQRAYKMSQEINNPWLLAMNLNSMGTFESKQNRSEKALAYYAAAQSYMESLGDLRGLSMVVYNMGVEIEKKEPKQARAYYEQSLHLKRQIGDQAGVARRLAVIAYLMMLNEEVEEATEYIEESIHLSEYTGDRFRLSFAIMTKACIYYVMADFADARNTLEQGIEILEQLDYPERLAAFYHFLAFICLVQKEISAAENNLEKMVALLVDHQTPYLQWLALVGYALFYWATGERETSARISTIVFRLQTVGSAFDVQYMLKPHIYRVQQEINVGEWETLQEETTRLDLEAAFVAFLNA